ncbi:MAG: hypothetical protein H7844_14150 [Nitrospirae bacterium YQR-1]
MNSIVYALLEDDIIVIRELLERTNEIVPEQIRRSLQIRQLEVLSQLQLMN